MQNLNFDDGYKSFMINEDPNRVIRFNPADVGILSRIQEATDSIENGLNGLKEDFDLNPDGTPVSQMEQAAEAVRKVTNLVKEQINYIFNSDVSGAVFGRQSPLSLVGGMPLYERFIETVMPVIKKTVQEEQKKSEKRVGKYVEMVRK